MRLVHRRLRLGLQGVQTANGGGISRFAQLLSQERLYIRVLAHHHGLHLPRPVHLVRVLLQRHFSHSQAGVN